MADFSTAYSGRRVDPPGQISRARRHSKIGILGIDKPIEVFELTDSSSERWMSMTAHYHEALSLFENRRFQETARDRCPDAEHPTDVPSRKLLARVLHEMDESNADFDGVWTLTNN